MLYLGKDHEGIYLPLRGSFGNFTEAFDGDMQAALAECARRNQRHVAALEAEKAARTVKVFTPAPEITDDQRINDARRHRMEGEYEKAIGTLMCLKRFSRMSEDAAEDAARKLLSGGL